MSTTTRPHASTIRRSIQTGEAQAAAYDAMANALEALAGTVPPAQVESILIELARIREIGAEHRDDVEESIAYAVASGFGPEDIFRP